VGERNPREREREGHNLKRRERELGERVIVGNKWDYKDSLWQRFCDLWCGKLY
jgi:hypothetical protein